MKCPRLGCKQEEFISHSSEVWKSKIEVPAGLLSGEGLSLVCRWRSSLHGSLHGGGREGGSEWSALVVYSPSY